MTGRNRFQGRYDREAAKRAAAAPRAGKARSTPYQKLLLAAETGQFEDLVRQARPAQPVAMVTPQEREAELRAAGRWPADKRTPKPARQPAPQPAAEPEREPTPNEQYIAEHCHWRRRGPADTPSRHRQGQCLTEYDPITGELIGDGYIDDEEDDQ